MPRRPRHACSAVRDRMSDGAGAPRDRTPRPDRACLRLPRQALMQRFFCRTFGWRAVSCLVKLVQLLFKLLVHEQQRFKCATHIAVAAGYNLIDNDVGVIYNTSGYGARHGYILELMTNSLHPFRLDVSFCTLFTGRKPITFSEMLGLARRRATGLPG